MASPVRYPKLTPNRAFLMANHWPDRICSMTMLDTSRLLRPPTHVPQIRFSPTPSVRYPPTSLRFFFPCGEGVSVENSIPAFIFACIDEAIEARLAKHPTQGLIARVMQLADVKPANIGRGS